MKWIQRALQNFADFGSLVEQAPLGATPVSVSRYCSYGPVTAVQHRGLLHKFYRSVSSTSNSLGSVKSSALKNAGPNVNSLFKPQVSRKRA